MPHRASDSRNKRIQIRLTTREDRLIRTGARLLNKEISEFLLSTACTAAQHAMADQCRFMLSQKAWKEFTAALERPAQIKPKLRELFSVPSVLEK